ncbi:DUF3106 domain-containing protein [Thiomonas sp. FB-Cd]|uniref:DUF3106 domain-containing protein n=1 Tax=Thiomonas sp. FB-Cd TaxID=1158292 RepID=UPI00068D9E10|nr:DUF3106 domain-containing protein [Thiomonas sp. FB-Cd]
MTTLRGRRSSSVSFILRLLFATILLAMASTRVDATEPTHSLPSWEQLSPMQKEALGPLQAEWPHFDADRKRKWLNIASRYPAMSVPQRATLHHRMAEWVQMTPQQRRLARENFLATGKAPLDTRKKAWERYQKLPEARKHELAREAKSPPHAPGHVGRYESEQRLKRPAAPLHSAPAGSPQAGKALPNVTVPAPLTAKPAVAPRLASAASRQGVAPAPAAAASASVHP